MAAAPASLPTQPLVVCPTTTCPWGEADRSWTGAAEDQLHQCVCNSVALEVLQSVGIEAAKEEGGKSLQDDVRVGNTGLVVWYSAPMLCAHRAATPASAVVSAPPPGLPAPAVCP
jgi:hypothetical protein